MDMACTIMHCRNLRVFMFVCTIGEWGSCSRLFSSTVVINVKVVLGDAVSSLF